MIKKINTDFHGNKMPKKSSEYICLSVILLDYVFTTIRNYYPQVFLEKCKYVIKEKIIVYYLWYKNFFRFRYRRFW